MEGDEHGMHDAQSPRTDQQQSEDIYSSADRAQPKTTTPAPSLCSGGWGLGAKNLMDWTDGRTETADEAD